MRDQLTEPQLSDKDLQRVFKALKENGFKPLLTAEFVKGHKKVVISKTGFTWKDGSYVEQDLGVFHILKKIRQ